MIDGTLRKISYWSTDTETKAENRYERLHRLKYRLFSNTLSIIGVLMILTVVFTAIFAPYIAPYPSDAGTGVHYDRISEPPSLNHPMGTDQAGRDILSRVMFGARMSLTMGFVVLSIAVSIGVQLGLIAGYVGGYTQSVIMRTTDIFLSVPPILLAMAVAAVLSPSRINVMIAIAFAWWPWYTRIVHGEVLSMKEEEFVEASESLGAGRLRVMFKELLPNMVAPITVKATLDFGFVILVGAGLAFIGLGAQPPTPSWGSMIAQGRSNINTAWWMATMPGLAISFTVLGWNLLGDGLRDVFDVDVQ